MKVREGLHDSTGGCSPDRESFGRTVAVTDDLHVVAGTFQGSHGAEAQTSSLLNSGQHHAVLVLSISSGTFVSRFTLTLLELCGESRLESGLSLENL